MRLGNRYIGRFFYHIICMFDLSSAKAHSVVSGLYLCFQKHMLIYSDILLFAHLFRFFALSLLGNHASTANYLFNLSCSCQPFQSSNYIRFDWHVEDVLDLQFRNEQIPNLLNYPITTLNVLYLMILIYPFHKFVKIGSNSMVHPSIAYPAYIRRLKG